MSTTPPEANTEYSRGLRDSRGSPDRQSSPSAPSSAVLGAVLCGGVLGSLLLAVAEFTTLYNVHSTASQAAIKSVGTGSHNSYALIPLAVLAAVLSFAVWRAASRPALLALGVVGVIALLIGLLGDLPDAHASGLLGSSATHYVVATSRPSAGFYMETLGSVLLVIGSVSGFILLGPPSRDGGARRRAPVTEG